MRKTKKNTRKLYHYGLTMRIYPSFIQQNTANKNINAARFYYNFLVAQDHKLYEIGKEPSIYIKCITDRREQLLSHGDRESRRIILDITEKTLQKLDELGFIAEIAAFEHFFFEDIVLINAYKI